MEPPAKRPRKLFEDGSSDSEPDDGPGGVPLNGDSEEAPTLKINEEYARRFEHNKKREELQHLEAKLGKTSALGKRKKSDDEEDDTEDPDESSESEDEDEEGELVTEALDSEIHATLNAIRSKDPRVYDKNAKFYSESKEDEGTDNQEKKEKPMYLRDYHRQNLLSGANTNEDEETPKTFAQEQEELKRTVVQAMHAAAEDKGSDDEDMDDDGDFLIPKSTQVPEDNRPEVQLDVEHADKDPEKFLSDFMSARAWIPAKSSRFQAFESDDDEEEARAEAFEEAYNFRFEDPNKMNEIILTHARDAANQFSVRREELSGRKKRREAERLKKEEEKKQRESEKNRLRKLKMEELEEKLKKIKQAAGIKAADISDEEWLRLLDENWDDEKWEKEMQKRFGEEYYAQPDEGLSGDDADAKEKKHPKKPTWDDDIDIKDIVPDFEEEEKPPLSLSDEDMEDDEDGTAGSKSKKQDKRDKKRAARKERRLIEEAVDRNLELDPTLLPGATKKNSSRFRYRETSPQSFGLTVKDILMADDAQLNEFVGLKKLAAFRDPEKKRRDQKKMGKKARLRQWRRDVFGDEEGPKLELPVNADAAGPKDDQDDEMKVDIREGGSRKKRKRSKKH